jgi:cyclic beta-1,2-glucan synthetase
MQRAGVETILGLRIGDDVLHLNLCIPKTWPRFAITARFRSAQYEILVENPSGVCHGIVAATVDGTAVGQRPLNLKMVDDGSPTVF